jgi:hypothetical protein
MQQLISQGLAFFYCDFKDPKTHDPLVVLGALAKQFALQESSCFEKLEKFYDYHYSDAKGENSQISIPITATDLCKLIRDMSMFFDDALVIIDALDECQKDRSQLIDYLTCINIPGESNIKTIFTSRRETDIEMGLADYMQLSIAATSSDLRLYVASEIESRIRRRTLRIRDLGLKEEIMNRLIGGAEGM